MKPMRIQRKRTRGWRIPENTVCVTRPGKWGNLFEVGSKVPDYCFERLSGLQKALFPNRTVVDAKGAVILFEKFQLPSMNPRLLKGKNLACWCKEGEPCHGDVLLEKANP